MAHEICAALGFYTSRNDNFLPTFWENLSVPFSRVKPWRWARYVVLKRRLKITLPYCEKSQMSTDPIDPAVEASNHRLATCWNTRMMPNSRRVNIRLNLWRHFLWGRYLACKTYKNFWRSSDIPTATEDTLRNKTTDMQQPVWWVGFRSLTDSAKFSEVV
jgi:hypothetical protein